jgi:hypothetical protein
MILKNPESVNWVIEMLAISNLGKIFRLWAPGEEPEDQLMTIYLNTDYDGVSTELIIRTIKTFNADIPLEFSMVKDVEPQMDRYKKLV